METRRWTNPSQPQTLYMAHIMFYINAAFTVLFSGLIALFPFGILLVAASVAVGYGIANERRWGYFFGIALVVLELLPYAYILVLKPSTLFNLAFILAVAWPVILFVLLVHPMSREYQKIWFK